LDGDQIFVLVNHWPSRRGGEAATAHLRNAGADICKAVSDSLNQVHPDAKVIVMGDLNDDPTSPSIKKHLGAQKSKKKVKKDGECNDNRNVVVDCRFYFGCDSPIIQIAGTYWFFGRRYAGRSF
jgi:hypothetical protein